jgi:hypothetical protein
VKSIDKNNEIPITAKNTPTSLESISVDYESVLAP